MLAAEMTTPLLATLGKVEPFGPIHLASPDVVAVKFRCGGDDPERRGHSRSGESHMSRERCGAPPSGIPVAHSNHL